MALEAAQYKCVSGLRSLPAHAIGRPAYMYYLAVAGYMDLPAVAGKMACKKAGGEDANYKSVGEWHSRWPI